MKHSDHKHRTGEAANGFKHGHATRGIVTPEYRAWAGLRSRCLNRRNHKYSIYGGRGIKVCARWNEFLNFLADMGNRPTPRHSVERKDNNGDYKPGNCIWATPEIQQRNRSNTRRLTFMGASKTMTEFAAERGMRVGTLWNRLDLGWSTEEALTRPLRKAA